jgi:group I intron endonuclease
MKKGLNFSCIYIIVNPRGKVYIGQTNNYIERYDDYKKARNIFGQRRVYNSILKYGFHNHTMNVLRECDSKELNAWEAFYINLFSSTNADFGLNIRYGGGSKGKHSDETKILISKSKTGIKRKPFSKSWIDNISKSHKNINKDAKWLLNLKIAAEKRKEMGGYVITESQKEKFRESYKKYLKSEKGMLHAASSGGRCKKIFGIPINQYTKEGDFIKTWDSARCAAKGLGLTHPNIVNCCNNKAKSAGGFVWKKRGEVLNN